MNQSNLYRLACVALLFAGVLVSAYFGTRTTPVIAQTQGYSLAAINNDLAAGTVTALSSTDMMLPVFQIYNDSVNAQVYLKCRKSGDAAITTITPGAAGVLHLRPNTTLAASAVYFNLSPAQKFNPRLCSFQATGGVAGEVLSVIYSQF